MPLKPGGRQPPLAHGMQTVNCWGRPFSRPVNETITSVERLFWQATQVATSALLPLAFSLGIALIHLVGPVDQDSHCEGRASSLSSSILASFRSAVSKPR